jgi:GT2 family glycosyltransferase
MPDVSVVIPSVGRPSAERTVASVRESAASGGIDAEIILVWQGEHAPSRMDGATVIPVHAVNVSYTRNRGIDEASAELLAFADDDEVVDRRWLEAALRALADADAAFGPVDPLDQDGRPHCYLDHAPPQVFAGYAQPWLVGTGGSMAFRKEALASIGGFNLRLGAGSVGLSGEEPDAIWRLLRAGGRIRWSPEMIAYHPTKDDDGVLETRYPYGVGTGRILGRARSPRLIATSAYSILHANGKALACGKPTERREAAAFGRGVITGLTRPTRWLAPDLAREAVPAEITEALRGRPAVPLPVPMQPPPHYVWACGDAILHAFLGPDAAQLDGPAAREAIGSLPAVERVPSVLACARSRDALWVLEDRVEGREPDLRNPAEWWAGAAEWVTSYACHTGRPYRDSEEWRREREHWLRCAPEGLGERVNEALERLADLPSSPSHGALHTGNLVLTEAGVTAIGWARATTEGIPGADLLLLAATNRRSRPDESTLRALADGRNPSFGDVLTPLRAVGLDGQARNDALLALLLKWANAERVQHRALGGEPQTPEFEPIARRLVPLLVSRSRSDVSMPPAVAPKTVRLALVVVTRDRAEVFERFALPSLRHAASDAEILVVDQSAGSDTRDLLRDLPGARYLRSEPGLSRGRNVGVYSTEAEIVVFVDDDVEFDADWPGRVAALFDDPEIGVVCGRGRDSSGQLLPGRRAGNYRWPTNPFNVGHGFNMAFRRAALEEAGPFDERLGAGAEVPSAEDTDMFHRVLRNGWTVRCDDGITVRHHDWRTHEAQCAAFVSYGRGFAAQTVKHVGSGDLTAARMAGRHLANHCRWAALSAVRRDRRGLAYQSAWARGVVLGLARRNGSRVAAP